VTVSRRHGAALLTGLAVGALLIGATIALTGAAVAPPDETAETVPLPPSLPLPIVTPVPVPALPAVIVPVAKAQARPRPATAPAASGPEMDVVARTNAERISAGCPALRFDSRLATAARAHSADMVNRHYFEHNSPDGATPDDRAAAAGYPDLGGENIAYGQRSAAEVMNDWMNSPEHRSNILDCDYTTVGVGLDSRGMYWTQDFGY
jgi:uncharacterized protein YkwD